MSPKNEGVARKIADLGIQDWEIPELSGLWQQNSGEMSKLWRWTPDDKPWELGIPVSILR